MFRSCDENKITSTCITLTPELREAARLKAQVELLGATHSRDPSWHTARADARQHFKSSIEEATLVLST